MNTPDEQKKYIAFNTQLLFIGAVFLCFLGCCILGFSEREYGFAIFFLFLCLLAVFIFLLFPVSVVFTSQDVTIVYFWGIREQIPWNRIRSITATGSWFLRHTDLPHYNVAYPKTEKTPFFVNGNIPKTRKTKKLLKQFYKKDII